MAEESEAMADVSSPRGEPDLGSENTSYDLSKVIRISAHASLLSWLFAGVGVIGLAFAAYGLFTTIAHWEPYDQVTEVILFSLIISFLLLVCFGSSVMMRAIAEGLLLLRDVEESARERR
jgi:hypothetical protein